MAYVEGLDPGQRFKMDNAGCIWCEESNKKYATKMAEPYCEIAASLIAATYDNDKVGALRWQ